MQIEVIYAFDASKTSGGKMRKETCTSQNDGQHDRTLQKVLWEYNPRNRIAMKAFEEAELKGFIKHVNIVTTFAKRMQRNIRYDERIVCT